MPDDAAQNQDHEGQRDETSRAGGSRPVLPDSGFDKYLDRLRSMGDMRLRPSAEPESGGSASGGSAFGGSASGGSAFGTSAFGGSTPDHHSGPLEFDALWSTSSELDPVIEPVVEPVVELLVEPEPVEPLVEDEPPERVFQPRTLRPALPPVRSAQPPAAPVQPAARTTWSSDLPALSPALPPLPAALAASQPPQAVPPVDQPSLFEARAAELKEAELRAAEQRAAEQRAAEQREAKQRAARRRAAEERAAEVQAIRERAAQEQVAQDQRAAQNWAAELRAADERRAAEEGMATDTPEPVDPPASTRPLPLLKDKTPEEVSPASVEPDLAKAVVGPALNGTAREPVPAAVSLFEPMVQPLPLEPDDFPVGATSSVVDELFAALRERNSALLARLENPAAPEPEPEPEPEPAPDREPEGDVGPETAEQPVLDLDPPAADPTQSLRPAQLGTGDGNARRGLRGLLEVGTEADPGFVPRPAPVTARDVPPALSLVERAAGDVVDLRTEPAPEGAIHARPAARDSWALDHRLTELSPPPALQPLTELELRSQEPLPSVPTPYEAARNETARNETARGRTGSDESVTGSPPYEPALVDLDSVFPDPIDEPKDQKRFGRSGGGSKARPRRGNSAHQQRGGGTSAGTMRRIVIPGLTALVVASVAAAVAFVVIDRIEDEPQSLRSGSPASSIAPEGASKAPANGAVGRFGPAKFGVSGGSSRSGVAGFGRWAGQDVDVVVDFPDRSSWQEIVDPISVIQKWAGSGYQLVLSTALLPDAEKASIADGAKGGYDHYYRALARNLVEAGRPDTIIRLGWDFNRSGSRWSTPSSSDFIAYWRSVVDAMRSVPGQDFTFDWSVAAGRTTYDATRYYPGPRYVDYVGVDVYDVSRAPGTYPYPAGCDTACRSTRQRAVWNRLHSADGGLNFWSRFAQAKGKAMSVPGWGLVRRADGRGGEDDPNFVKQMHAFIADPDNAVAYQAYADAGGSGAQNSLKDDFPQSGKVFRTLFG